VGFKDFAISFVVLIVAAFIFSLAYCDGQAKSQYLMERKNIKMPWYRAVHLPAEAFIDPTIERKEAK
jgi:hypothetical protein